MNLLPAHLVLKNHNRYQDNLTEDETRVPVFVCEENSVGSIYKKLFKFLIWPRF